MYQLSREMYARAEQFLPHKVKHLCFGTDIAPHWIGKSGRFWYSVRTRSRAKHFVTVDPKERTKTDSFDHGKLALSLASALGKQVEASDLPFDSIWFCDQTDAVRFCIEGDVWQADMSTYECSRVGELRDCESISPDGKWAAFTRRFDLWIRHIATGEERQLTYDGEEHFAYAAHPGSSCSAVTEKLLGKQPKPVLRWSPDSKRILTHQLDERLVEDICLLQHVPGNNNHRPIPHFYRYPLVGDEHLPLAHIVVIDVSNSRIVRGKCKPLISSIRTPIEAGLLWWDDTADRLYVVRLERQHNHTSVEAVDPDCGEVTTLLRHTSSTNAAPFYTPTDSPLVYVLRTGEVIWFSTCDGWGHLYLYAPCTETPVRQITSGSWCVRQILHVSEDTRQVYFTASGIDDSIDPYLRQLCSVGIDDGDCEILSSERCDHWLTTSPGGKWFVDTYSTIDSQPETVLRDQRGEVVMRLETADIEPLLETGWRAPQAFSAKARDGKTDIFGAMFFPSGFSPLRKYPVIDAIYPGPQVLRTPKRFPGEDDRSLKWYWEPQALAELGFIVVTIDGMGTPYRSRSFLEVSYGRQFGEAGGLEDHVAALNELGTRHEFMDTSKVGIYGHSGGGYASTRAMLKFPDFFKVAVSSAGNHNQLGYLNSWGEFWMGLYDPDTYSEQSNFDLAANLKGKLLLVHGDLDDNVHPALTMRMVYEFIKEDKDFDMLILPGRNHHMTDLTERSQKSGFIGDPYLMRKTWDYFVLHLMGATPPKYSLGRTRE